MLVYVKDRYGIIPDYYFILLQSCTGHSHYTDSILTDTDSLITDTESILTDTDNILTDKQYFH